MFYCSIGLMCRFSPSAQVKVMKFPDELESGKRPKKAANLHQQVAQYRNKVLQKVRHCC